MVAFRRGHLRSSRQYRLCIDLVAKLELLWNLQQHLRSLDEYIEKLVRESLSNWIFACN